MMTSINSPKSKDQQLPKDQEVLKRDETPSLISADKVEGTDIYNLKGKHLGEVEGLMIDKISGKVAYAVVSFGGFLGLGEQRRALPWSVFSYNTDLEGYVVKAEDEVLKSSPHVDDLDDTEWGSRVHAHFGVPPYWG